MLVLGRKDTSIRVKPEITEDLWHLEKIIAIGNSVSGSSMRKFVSDGGKAERKPVFIKLRVEKVEFHKPSSRLKLLGVITEGSPEEYVKVGSHHSLDVDTGDIINISKREWKGYELDRLKEAQAATKRPKLFVLIMDERDAELFAVKAYGIDSVGGESIEGGGKYAEERKDIKHKWYSEIHKLIETKEGLIIIAGPAFEKDNFLSYLKDKDTKLAKRVVVDTVNNTGAQGVYELVSKGTIDKITKESRFAEETKAIDRLIVEISRERPKATYGLKNVRRAVDYGAAEAVLVVDALLFEKKADVEPVLNQAEKMKTKIMIVSRENDVSQKLSALGGIAALLRFQLPE
jgi:protein pelota